MFAKSNEVEITKLPANTRDGVFDAIEELGACRDDGPPACCNTETTPRPGLTDAKRGLSWCRYSRHSWRCRG